MVGRAGEDFFVVVPARVLLLLRVVQRWLDPREREQVARRNPLWHGLRCPRREREIAALVRIVGLAHREQVGQQERIHRIGFCRLREQRASSSNGGVEGGAARAGPAGRRECRRIVAGRDLGERATVECREPRGEARRAVLNAELHEQQVGSAHEPQPDCVLVVGEGPAHVAGMDLRAVQEHLARASAAQVQGGGGVAFRAYDDCGIGCDLLGRAVVAPSSMRRQTRNDGLGAPADLALLAVVARLQVDSLFGGELSEYPAPRSLSKGPRIRHSSMNPSWCTRSFAVLSSPLHIARSRRRSRSWSR